MKLPNPAMVDTADLVGSLRISADLMNRLDGDRDYGNPSRLTAGQVRDAFRLMLIAADKFEFLFEVAGTPLQTSAMRQQSSNQGE